VKELSKLKPGMYARVPDQFPRHAAGWSRFLKNLKERAIVIQDFDLAASLREAQKKLEAYIPKNSKRRGGGK
jgi:hypothetical protein